MYMRFYFQHQPTIIQKICNQHVREDMLDFLCAHCNLITATLYLILDETSPAYGCPFVVI